MSRHYKVSEISAATGVPPATLRLWEQHGLIEPTRTASGYRLYSESDFALVHQIVRLRSVQGLNLAAIKSSLKETSQANAVHAAGGEGPPSPRLGHEIRRIRKQRRLTLVGLAECVGVSVSTLSVLERTSRGVSVPLLRQIAMALGTTITELTANPTAPVDAVVRAGEGHMVPSLNGILIRELASGPRMMDCQEWTLEPGKGSEGFYRHDGEEFIRVLDGSLEIEVEGIGISTLGKGDSIYFESHRAHSWRCVSRESCVLIWINTPPTF